MRQGRSGVPLLAQLGGYDGRERGRDEQADRAGELGRDERDHERAWFARSRGRRASGRGLSASSGHVYARTRARAHRGDADAPRLGLRLWRSKNRSRPIFWNKPATSMPLWMRTARVEMAVV